MSTQPPDAGGYYTNNFHQCNWCGKTFSNSSALIIHQRNICGHNKIDRSQSPTEVNPSSQTEDHIENELTLDSIIRSEALIWEISSPSSSQSGPVLVDNILSEFVASYNPDSDLEILETYSSTKLDRKYYNPNSDLEVLEITRLDQKAHPDDNHFDFVSEECRNYLLAKVPGTAKRSRDLKVWEFLMRLLRHPDTNPALIAWQGGSNYEFKLEKPNLVIKLWNGRSGKVT